MAEYDQQLKKLLLPADESFFELIVRYGLYVGAAFQIACLLALVVHYGNSRDSAAALKDDASSDVDCSENSPQVTPRRPHRPRKQEKKKRR